jgi:hypothetical protein
MEALHILGDETTPLVDFDAATGVLKMSGVAIPEDVREFFKPIKNWVTTYAKHPQSATELILDFEYLNTAASKMVFEMCDIVSAIHGSENYRVKLTWKYHRGDIEMLELGEEIFEQFFCLKEIQAIDNHIY